MCPWHECPPAPALGDRPGSLLGVWRPWGDPPSTSSPAPTVPSAMNSLFSAPGLPSAPSFQSTHWLACGGRWGELRALGVSGLCLRWEAGGLRASKASGESGPLPCAARTLEGWARTIAASLGRGLRGSSQTGLRESGSERPSDVCPRCSRLRDVTPVGPGKSQECAEMLRWVFTPGC